MRLPWVETRKSRRPFACAYQVHFHHYLDVHAYVVAMTLLTQDVDERKDLW